MNTTITIRKLPPVWFIGIISAFRKYLLWLHKRTFPANVVLYEHFQYFWFLPCLRVAAELNIAQLIENNPQTVHELAKRTSTNPENLHRLIRALASQGVFKIRKDGKVANTNLSKPLLEGQGSLRFMIMQHLGKLNWSTFNELSYSIHTGNDAFSSIYGEQIYDYISKNREEYELFDKSMTNLSEMSIEPLLSAYSFKDYQTLADVGGGEGLLLSSILFKYPHIQGKLFDLPDALGGSAEIASKYGVQDRLIIETGNFFETAPTDVDGYILKNIIHNWSDAESIQILKNIRQVMKPSAKVLLIEMVIDESNQPSFSKLLDIQMMVFMHAGKERTRREYETIAEQAGFKIQRIIHTIAPISIIELTRKETMDDGR